MWFKNKLTGLVWEVEGETAERLSLSPDYETVEQGGVEDGRQNADNDETGTNEDAEPRSNDEEPGPNDEAENDEQGKHKRKRKR